MTKFLKNSLFRLLDKEFLIFLSFLAVSGAFWLLMALNETVERELIVPVSLVNLPKNAVLTTEMEDTVRITVRDKGYTIASYLYGKRIQPVSFNFQTYAKSNGHGQIPASEITKQVRAQLYGSTQVTAVKPDRLEFFYNFGCNKSVPVKVMGHLLPGENYYITRTVVQPDSVIVYAAESLLDSISFVETNSLNVRDITDTLTVQAQLKPIKGVKLVPQYVRIAIFPDVLTEKTVEVPITAVNMPADKMLRTFPSRVPVRFVIGASKFRTVDERGFRVIADYNELMEHPQEKCAIHLISTPAAVNNPRLDIEQVDYLIEQQ